MLTATVTSLATSTCALTASTARPCSTRHDRQRSPLNRIHCLGGLGSSHRNGTVVTFAAEQRMVGLGASEAPDIEREYTLYGWTRDNSWSAGAREVDQVETIERSVVSVLLVLHAGRHPRGRRSWDRPRRTTSRRPRPRRA